jgi:tetrapyrrole methylase family protein/MazG family protein
MNPKSFDKLVRLAARLRAKNGCPWDRAQTHSSIKKYLIEEAYEVCEVIDSKNSEKLKDELGDLLFQVLFHSQIAKERGAFDIDGVLRASYRKMIRRHPHVFGRSTAKGPEDAYLRWEAIKRKEINGREKRTLLRGVPARLPALLKAQKVSKRAARAGSGWPDINSIVEELGEKLKEVKKALRYKNKRKRADEIGDMFFALANLACFLDIDAEGTLNKATKKFANRFNENRRGAGKTTKKD